MRVLDVGFGSVALETSGGAIFRVARTRAAAEGHALERRLLPALADALSVSVPEPQWRVEPGGDLPFGAIGHERLPGSTPTPGDVPTSVARELGRLLAELHGFPVEQAERLGVPRAPSPAEWLAWIRPTVLPVIRDRLEAGEHARLAAWWAAVEEGVELRRFTPALVHGDLWYAHLLISGEPPRLVGILDWESASIGDPARDLAVQLHLGEAFADAVRDAYASTEANLVHRVRRYWELRELVGLFWAVEQGDAAELEDALRKLRAGAILTPG